MSKKRIIHMLLMASASSLALSTHAQSEAILEQDMGVARLSSLINLSDDELVALELKKTTWVAADVPLFVGALALFSGALLLDPWSLAWADTASTAVTEVSESEEENSNGTQQSSSASDGASFNSFQTEGEGEFSLSSYEVFNPPIEIEGGPGFDQLVFDEPLTPSSSLFFERNGIKMTDVEKVVVSTKPSFDDGEIVIDVDQQVRAVALSNSAENPIAVQSLGTPDDPTSSIELFDLYPGQRLTALFADNVDTAAIRVQDCGTASSGFAELRVEGGALETIDLISEGRPNKILASTLPDSLSTFNIKGSSDLVLSLSDVGDNTDLTLIDGSDLKSNLTLDAPVSFQSITTGKGDDEVTLPASLTVNQSVAMGSGEDTLIVKDGDVRGTLNGVEHLVVAGEDSFVDLKDLTAQDAEVDLQAEGVVRAVNLDTDAVSIKVTNDALENLILNANDEALRSDVIDLLVANGAPRIQNGGAEESVSLLLESARVDTSDPMEVLDFYNVELVADARENISFSGDTLDLRSAKQGTEIEVVQANKIISSAAPDYIKLSNAETTIAWDSEFALGEGFEIKPGIGQAILDKLGTGVNETYSRFDSSLHEISIGSELLIKSESAIVDSLFTRTVIEQAIEDLIQSINHNAVLLDSTTTGYDDIGLLEANNKIYVIEFQDGLDGLPALGVDFDTLFAA